jgi:glucokinase
MAIIGLDIGGTKCAVVRADGRGRITGVKRFPTRDAASTLEKLCDLVGQTRPGRAPLFGVSCGGPLDSDRGIILSPPNLPGWDEVPIVRELLSRFGGEAYLMNDANAGALAEWTYGAARGCRNVIFLTHGTGMGAGLIIDGRLYEGAIGMAGEVGHVRMAARGPVGYGKAGSFEGFTSGGGIAKVARARAVASGGMAAFVKGRVEGVTARDVAEAAKAGDALARDILAESGRWLGLGLAVLVDILNPEIIVLGGIYRRCRRFMEPAMREALEREALPQSLAVCRVVPAALAEEIGNYAAVAAALYRKGRLTRE